MDLKEINKIVALMEEKNLSHFKLKRDGDEVELKRGLDADAIAAAISKLPSAGHSSFAPPPVHEPAGPTVLPNSPALDGGPVPDGPSINCPMVGTFYLAPSPGETPFVKVGDQVDEDTTVCIVEAMKVLNEIKAETRGTIKRVLAKDASPVQYGDALFEIEP